MRSVTRTLKGLLIAVTLGAVVVLVWRARASRAAAAGTAEAGPGPEPTAPPSPAPPRPAVPHVSTRERAMAPERDAAPEPATVRAELPLPFAPVELTSSAPAALARHEPLHAAPGPLEADRAPARRRRGLRSPLGVGLLALAVIAAGVGGTFAYKGIADDDAQNVAATTPDQPAGSPAPTSSGPAVAPQRFTKVAAKSGGTLNKATVEGRRSGVTADVWVWLPRGTTPPPTAAVPTPYS